MTKPGDSSQDWQQWAVAGIVLMVLLLFARSWWQARLRGGSGCGGNCGCPTAELKKLNK